MLQTCSINWEADLYFGLGGLAFAFRSSSSLAAFASFFFLSFSLSLPSLLPFPPSLLDFSLIFAAFSASASTSFFAIGCHNYVIVIQSRWDTI